MQGCEFVCCCQHGQSASPHTSRGQGRTENDQSKLTTVQTTELPPCKPRPLLHFIRQPIRTALIGWRAGLVDKSSCHLSVRMGRGFPRTHRKARQMWWPLEIPEQGRQSRGISGVRWMASLARTGELWIR